MDDDDIPQEALDNSVSFPVADTGLGEAVCTLRIVQEIQGPEALTETLRAISMSAATYLKCEVVFGTAVPPPLLVTLEDVARSLALDHDEAKELALLGWLTPVHHRGVEGDERAEQYVSVESMLDAGHWQGHEVRFRWAELVGLAQWIAEHRYIPTYPAPARTRLVKAKKQTVAAAVRRVLQESKNKDGSPRFMSRRTILQHAQRYVTWKKIEQSAVQTTLLYELEAGRAVRRKSYGDDEDGKVWRYQWAWVDPEISEKSVQNA